MKLLLVDHDRGKTFAFTPYFYFEVAPQVKLIRHDVKFPPSAEKRAIPNNAYTAIDLLAQCARVTRGLPEPKAK